MISPQINQILAAFVVFEYFRITKTSKQIVFYLQVHCQGRQLLKDPQNGTSKEDGKKTRAQIFVFISVEFSNLFFLIIQVFVKIKPTIFHPLNCYLSFLTFIFYINFLVTLARMSRARMALYTR